MKIDRVYTENVPVWKCLNNECKTNFAIELANINWGFQYWRNDDSMPYCPVCGYKNCKIITTFTDDVED